MSEVVVERTIAAPAAVVYELFTDPALLVEWMAESAETDVRPGGRWRWTHANGDTTCGEFVELVPHRLIVFTYGWEQPELGIPPGSTRVEVHLTELEGRTRVKVVHSGLDEAAAANHRGGWQHYLGRLAVRACGGEPGPDAAASLRANGAPSGRAAPGDPAGVDAKTRLFWQLAERLLVEGRAERGTMMGFPCLRAGGAFFASLERGTGDLVVKLPAGRVAELVAAGEGIPFAPAGRVFREWVASPLADAQAWAALLEEAHRFVDVDA